MITLSKEIMILLGGNAFIPASYSLNIMCILTIINCIGSWQINQILIPYKKENIALNIQICGSIISIMLNAILVPKLSYIGSAIAWCFTEILLVILGCIAIKKVYKNINIKYFIESFKKYFIAAIIMLISICTIKIFIKQNLLVIFTCIIISPTVYILTCIILKDYIVVDIVKNLIIINKIKNLTIKSSELDL